MTDKTIKNIANTVLALITAATVIFILKAFGLSPSHMFWEVLAAVLIAETAVGIMFAGLAPGFLKRLRSPRVRMQAMYDFRLSSAESGNPRGTLRLAIRNDGDIALMGYRWHIFIPKDLRPEITRRDGDRTVAIGTRRVGDHEYATGIVRDALFPKTAVELPYSFRLESHHAGHKEWTLRYAVSTEFGQCPAEIERHETLDASAAADCKPLILHVE
ncbi:MAG: hypothetical protein U9Q03_01775 [Patescibacteria group bacterium]|nr:hypothetical protein [Patescibacteria group bacterium]